MAAVLRAVRKESSQAVLFSQAVAERIGLAGTDIECLEVLQEEGRATVGRLAELTGLTTGSATRMVDRLAQAGYVTRVADPADRRRVVVEPVAGLAAKFGALYASIATSQRVVIERYSDEQLATLIDFLDRSGEMARQEAAKMRAPSEEADAGGSYSAPVGGVSSGRLVFLSGAPNISVRGDATLTELYRADFAGPVPRMRVRGGVVTVSYPHFGWFDWRAQVAGQSIVASAHWPSNCAAASRVGSPTCGRSGSNRSSFAAAPARSSSPCRHPPASSRSGSMAGSRGCRCSARAAWPRASKSTAA